MKIILHIRYQNLKIEHRAIIGAVNQTFPSHVLTPHENAAADQISQNDDCRQQWSRPGTKAAIINAGKPRLPTWLRENA